MRTILKNTLALLALATTFTLASCQSESIEPKAKSVKKPTESHPAYAKNDDQPPKDNWPGGQ